jgi:ElaB/YqjD/DUF883 family membrane-anchored ribosome-binding protein
MRTTLIEQAEQLKGKVSQTAREAQEQLTHLAEEAAERKAAIAEAVEDGMHTARRAAKHGYRATEDFVDDTAHRIKQDPLRAVGISFLAGIGLGMALGWLVPHRTRA